MENKRQSAEIIAEYQKELDYLKNVTVPEVNEQLKIARSYGDLSENREYDEARNRQAFVYGRISELEQLLAYAKAAESNG